jgi:hypothetical protein
VTCRARTTDALGRVLGPSATRVLRRIVEEVSCENGGHCHPQSAVTGRWVCPHCGAHWSATATAGRAMISRAALPCGIDVERADRQRPAAYRAVGEWCGTPVRDARQWTQVEAIWKALRPAPRLGRDLIPIPISTTAGAGWQLSADSSWWVNSRSADGEFVWTVAVRRASGPARQGLEAARNPSLRSLHG